MLVHNMYDKLAINTGFPLYVSETDTPETTRFLLEMLSQALLNVIDNIYISNNVLERRDTITLTPGKSNYPVEGMVKSIQYLREGNPPELVGRFVLFNRMLDIPNQVLPRDQYGHPISYVIDRGEIRLLPIPEKPYRLQVTVSTNDLVWANDDSSRNTIESIDDSVMASKDFCELVIIKACAFVMARCQNPLADFYNGLYNDRLRSFIERDSQSFEEPKTYNPRAGHYNPRRGLF